MTWQEFKNYVDKVLGEEYGLIPSEVDVDYIDSTFPSLSHESSTPHVGVETKVDSKHLIVIWN